MLIIKSEKMFLVCLLTVVMLLSGLFYIPATVNAEAKDETSVSDVTVLGATLRLTHNTDNSNGKQSLRIGIRVDKADTKKECAIVLTIGGKSYTVSTKGEGKTIGAYTVDKQCTGLHSKDMNNKSITYAVVLEGIPQTAFNTDIKITGITEDADGKAVSSEATRTVNGVVESLSARYPGLGISIGEDGILYKNYPEKVMLVENDLNYYDSANLEGYELDLSKTEYDNNTSLTIENSSITLNSDNSGRLYIPLPRTAYVGEQIVIYISGKITGDSFKGFRCWTSNTEDSGAKDRRMSDKLEVKTDKYGSGEFFAEFLETNIWDADNKGKDKAQAICIKGPLGYGTDMGAKDLTITSVYVTYKSETAKPDYFNGFSSENDAWTMSNGKWDAVNKTYIYKSNGSGTGTYALPDSYTGNMTVSWRMKVNQTDGRAFVMLKDKSNKDIAQVEFRGGEGGNHNIIADAGDGTSPGSSGNIVNVTNTAYEANTWYDVKVVINKDGKYSVQIGDNDPVQFVGFKGAEATGEIQNITLGTRNANVELTIDDFTINVDKESE